MAIRLVIDTCSDLYPANLKTPAVILPIIVRIDGQEYNPLSDLTPHQFYVMQQQSHIFPTTCQVSLQTLLETFRKEIKAGNEVVGIFMGSKHSGTFNSALLARSQIEEEMGKEAAGQIFLVDSQNVTFPYAALVFEADRMIAEGEKSAKDIASRIEYLVPRIKMRAFIDDLSYLERGGRISKTAALFGNLLNFKVVICTGMNDIHVTDKVRGMPRVFPTILQAALDSDADYSMPTYLGFTYDLGKAEKLREYILANSKFVPNPKPIEIGATVGAHVGPGSTGFCWFIK